MTTNHQLLTSVRLFEKLPPKTIDRIERLLVEREFPAGTAIVTEGTGGVGFFLIKDGAAEVRRGSESTVVRLLGQGDYFGDMALLDGQQRSATVQALETTRCLALTRWDFLAEVRSDPELAIGLLEALSLRLRDAEAQLDASQAAS